MYGVQIDPAFCITGTIWGNINVTQIVHLYKAIVKMAWSTVGSSLICYYHHWWMFLPSAAFQIAINLAMAVFFISSQHMPVNENQQASPPSSDDPNTLFCQNH